MRFDDSKIAARITLIALIVNAVLAVAKLSLGLIFGNLAVISDAVHSIADLVISIFIFLIAFICSTKFGTKHRHACERMQRVVAMILSIIMIGVVGLFVWRGIEGLLAPVNVETNFYLIGIAVFSLFVKEILFRYEIYYAKRMNSEMLKADAWHHRTDSLSSGAVLVGLVMGSFTGNNLVESIAVLIVAALILKVAIGIFRSAVKKTLREYA